MSTESKSNGWKIAVTVLLTLMVLGFSAATILPLSNTDEIREIKDRLSELRQDVAVNKERFNSIQAELEGIKANQQRILDKLDNRSDS